MKTLSSLPIGAKKKKKSLETKGPIFSCKKNEGHFLPPRISCTHTLIKTLSSLSLLLSFSLALLLSCALALFLSCSRSLLRSCSCATHAAYAKETCYICKRDLLYTQKRPATCATHAVVNTLFSRSLLHSLILMLTRTRYRSRGSVNPKLLRCYTVFINPKLLRCDAVFINPKL